MRMSRRPRHTHQAWTAAFFLLLALGLAAQQQGRGGFGNRGGRRMLPPMEAVTHSGRPAVKFQIGGGAAFIDYFEYQNEPVLAFELAQDQCAGQVYVTYARVRGDFRGPSCKSFDLPRESAAVERQAGKILLTSGANSYALVPVLEMDGQLRPEPRVQVVNEIFTRSIKMFPQTFAGVRRMATQSMAEDSGEAGQRPARSLAVSEATLTIHSNPRSQVFIDDEPRGSTGADGSETLQLPAGSYRVRVSLSGYKNFEQAVSLAAGQSQSVNAQLQVAGPPAFSESQVAEMLKGEMSPKRISTLVGERGVNFALNTTLEKQFKDLGATSDLLLAIATHRR